MYRILTSSNRVRLFACAALSMLTSVSASFAQDKPNAKKPSLKVAGVFGDGMVLQRETAASIWGWADAGTQVTISPSWTEQATQVDTDADGKWKATIDTPEAGGPFKIVVQSGEEKVAFNDVLSGEVWVCSGQSNMQWKMNGFGVDHFKEDVVKANHPQIRYFYVPQILALEEQDDLKGAWKKCNPNNVMQFSAVAYFFAEKLHRELGVPIGLVSPSWGGSTAEAWVPADTIEEEFPEFAELTATYAEHKEKTGVTYRRGSKKKPKAINHHKPSVLYNQMIHPVVPYTMRGVIWYQGESNVERPDQYNKLFPSLIESWREEWGQGDFPFYYVQISPFRYADKAFPVAFLREAQLNTLSVPNTGMAVTMDIGNPTNIHPKKKKPVGERLAILALAKDYGRDDIVYSGPQLKSQDIEGDHLRLHFDHVGGGLSTRDGEAPSHFMVAGSDMKFKPAQAKIDGETIVVRSGNVAKPVAVRYAWGNADEPNLMNIEGLPASSFRTDTLEPQRVQRRKGK